jgi:hypothetical protein
MTHLKGISISILLLTLLLISGFTLPVIAVTPSSNASVQIVSTPSPVTLKASNIISGPIGVTPTALTSVKPQTSFSTPPETYPNLNDKPLVGKGVSTNVATIPPTIPCVPKTSGCDSISTSSSANVNPDALNAVDDAASQPYIGTVEPPDQGLCAGNGYTVEILNQGELQVYNAKLQPVSGLITLDNLMGLTGLGYSSGGDIQCLYDYANGGHWFITQIVSTTSEQSGGPFAGCFAAATDACREGIAVSVTNNPLGAWNVYFFDPNQVNNDPGKGNLLNDFAKIATTKDAFLFFYDEFPLLTGGFNGAQEFAINKWALENGIQPNSPYFTIVYMNMGLLPTPDNLGCSPICSPAWYAVIPAQTPDPTQFDNNNGGTGFMVAALDFFGAGDNRIAIFDWTGLSSLNSYNCASCGSIKFGEQIIKGVETYMDEGFDCSATLGGFCGIAPQKAGPVPLGDNCQLAYSGNTQPCPENGIATNGDDATQASYANGNIWFALSTLVSQTFNGAPSELHVGAAYFAIGTSSFDSSGRFSLDAQGYVSAAHEDIEFPSLAATDGSVTLMSFTLSGNGGPSGADNGGYYPSAAYGLVSTTSGGLFSRTINIAALGQSPQDGFTEYTAAVGNVPRWGDYGAAIYVPSAPGSATGHILFGAEYIQHPNCNDAQFLKDPSCGGTRDPFANWGSAIGSLLT